MLRHDRGHLPYGLQLMRRAAAPKRRRLWQRGLASVRLMCKM